MSSVQDNFQKINKETGDDVLLVAVTKTHPADIINEAIDTGATDRDRKSVV